MSCLPIVAISCSYESSSSSACSCVSIRQHTSACVSIRQHTPLPCHVCRSPAAARLLSATDTCRIQACTHNTHHTLHIRRYICNICTCIYVYICIYICVYICAHARMYACIHTYVLSLSVLLQLMTHTRRDTPTAAAAAGKLKTAAGKLKLCVQLL